MENWLEAIFSQTQHSGLFVYDIQNDDKNLQNNSAPKCINIQNYSLYHSKIIHLLNFFFYAEIL